MKNLFPLLLLLLLATVVLKAQDYKISFAGAGASSTIGTVNVENLTQGKSISLLGTEVLHLVATSTGINPIPNDIENAFRIYPNPTTGICTIDFVATSSGRANIELFDITGNRISTTQNNLAIGNHSFKVSGLSIGIYTVRISSQSSTLTGKLVSNGAPSSNVKIVYIGSSIIPVTSSMLKSGSIEKIMQYNTGDMLKFTGTSGNYSTIVTEIPTQSKTMTFTFFPCTDTDMNNYSVVQIGTQLWMAENLKTAKYNDRTNIPNITNYDSWAKLTTPGYCLYGNNVVNDSTFGALYNWYTVNTGKLAPKGWHVPNDNEWTILTSYLGGESVAGSKLKETGTSLWASSLSSVTNEVGFTGLPAGTRDEYGLFLYIKEYGYWWCSASYDLNNAWGRSLGQTSSRVYRDYFYKNTGFSVRCIMDPLTIGTSSAYNISSITAICGGVITSEGGNLITERGVCFSTSPNPNTSNSKMIMGSGTGIFSNEISGLAPNTSYYVRAFATNSVGTKYGDEISFKTYPADSEIVTDIDGNVYHTVTIGTQVWLMENLKTTKYNDGTNIPNVTSNSGWNNLNSSGYCWYNNEATYKNIYGALYNWYTVNSGKVCPKGWHVPTHTEMTTLANYLGGWYVAGGKLKETGTTYWKSPNSNATNETFFTALPGGQRYTQMFIQIGSNGYWWSSSEYDSVNAWYYTSSSDDATFFGTKSKKNFGFSIRCIKD